MQNALCESFNGRTRDGLLNESLFFGIDHAREVIATWIDDYNTARPRSSLGYRTPAAYAATLTATGARLCRHWMKSLWQVNLIRMHLVPGGKLLDRLIAPQRLQRHPSFELARKTPSRRHLVFLSCTRNTLNNMSNFPGAAQSVAMA